MKETKAKSLSLVVRRTIRAPRERLFELWTQAEQLRQWWGPRGVTCCGAEIDLQVGGRYRIGNLLPDGNEVWIEGEFEVVSPPSLLRYTWRLGAQAPGAERVTVRFEPAPDGTEVVVVHERIADPATREGHLAGWEGCLDGLVRQVG